MSLQQARPLALLLAGLLLGGQQNVGADQASWEKAFARVEGVAILRSAVASHSGQGMTPAQALERLITLELVRSNLVRVGHDPAKVDAKALQQAMAKTRKSVEASGRRLEDLLAQAGQSMDSFRAGLQVPVALRGYVKTQTTQAVLRTLFKERALFLRGEVRASHILVGINAKRPAAAAKRRAEELLKELGTAPSKERFMELAQDKSDDPLATLTGGDLDWFTSRGKRGLAPSLVLAAFRHAKGFDPSDPTRTQLGVLPKLVRSRQGFHLVYLTEARLPAHATFERLRGVLEREAEIKLTAELLTRWRARTRIEYAPDAPRVRGPRREPSPSAGGKGIR